MFKRPSILPAQTQQTATLTVKTQINGVPAKRRISILDRKSQVLLWHSFTNADGEITRVLPLNYATADYLIVTALDDTGTYNAVVADNAQTALQP
ncbi:hypothetical protein [Rheinheimera aquimaris]|uniref:hypothetical protein n=1 Tax=Rheinheimera aquimaris TaxID=412437 RepID=UPI003A96FC68